MKVFRKLTSRLSLFFSQFYTVPYCVPDWGWAEHWTILHCLITGRVIDGPHKEKLCLAVRNKTGKKYVFGFNSGSDAIYAALSTRGIGAGDKAILPSYCCESVARAVARTGATPVFCDITDEYNPDVGHISTLMDPHVKAIIFPHLFGNPAAIDEMEETLLKSGFRSQILLIDDAAQSFGAKLNGRLIGTFGDVGIVSFGPGKTMIASGGGLLLTDSEEIASALKRATFENQLRSSKIKRLMYYLIFRRWRRFTLPFYFLFSRIFREHDRNTETVAPLCNVDAAIALAQLNKLETMLQIRMDRKKQLDGLLSTRYANLIDMQPKNDYPDEKLNVATKYVFRLKSEKDRDLQSQYKRLVLRNGIELFDLYLPLHKIDCYEKLQPTLPTTEKYCGRILQIPVEPSISDYDFESIIEVIPGLIQYLLAERTLDTAGGQLQHIRHS